jgi:uncharacterized protein YkwD
MEKDTDPISLNKEIFNKINEVRTNPLKLANKIALIMSYINKRDNVLREPNKPPVNLTEGIKSYEEAITFLKNFQPIEPFAFEDTLEKIAQEHATDIGRKGLTSSNSSDGKHLFEDRFKRYGSYTDLQECLVFFDADPQKIVISLIVCDGDENRTNRNLILSDNLRQVGVGTDLHIKFGRVTVIDFARNWKIRQIAPSSNGENNIGESSSVLNKKTDFNFNNFSKLINSNSNPLQENKQISNIEETIDLYEKELDNQIQFDNFIDKKEEKQVIQEENKFKLIKKFIFKFNDGFERKVVLSKTWFMK